MLVGDEFNSWLFYFSHDFAHLHLHIKFSLAVILAENPNAPSHPLDNIASLLDPGLKNPSPNQKSQPPNLFHPAPAMHHLSSEQIVAQLESGVEEGRRGAQLPAVELNCP
jgi:hypothetical protein